MWISTVSIHSMTDQGHGSEATISAPCGRVQFRCILAYEHMGLSPQKAYLEEFSASQVIKYSCSESAMVRCAHIRRNRYIVVGQKWPCFRLVTPLLWLSSSNNVCLYNFSCVYMLGWLCLALNTSAWHAAHTQGLPSLRKAC